MRDFSLINICDTHVTYPNEAGMGKRGSKLTSPDLKELLDCTYCEYKFNSNIFANLKDLLWV